MSPLGRKIIRDLEAVGYGGEQLEFDRAWLGGSPAHSSAGILYGQGREGPSSSSPEAILTQSLSMSMWEFEALTEMAVQLLSQSDLKAREQREFFANLYSMQDMFDCSFTHFRQRQTLEDVHFFFRIDPDQHPDHAAHEDYFRALVENGKDEWIKLPSTQGFGSDFYSAAKSSLPEYAHKSGIYFDVRSDLWRRCCEVGVLAGPAAEPFETWSVPELVARLVEVALRQPASQLRDSVIKGYYGWALVGIPEMLAPESRENERL